MQESNKQESANCFRHSKNKSKTKLTVKLWQLKEIWWRKRDGEVLVTLNLTSVSSWPSSSSKWIKSTRLLGACASFSQFTLQLRGSVWASMTLLHMISDRIILEHFVSLPTVMTANLAAVPWGLDWIFHLSAALEVWIIRTVTLFAFDLSKGIKSDVGRLSRLNVWKLLKDISLALALTFLILDSSNICGAYPNFWFHT